MDFNINTPIYMQIMDYLKREIVTGVLPHGQKLDSIRTMAEKFEVNLHTMHHAYIELERQGVIYSQRGVGNFVTSEDKIIAALKKEMSAQLLKNFISGMADLGYNDHEILELTGKELEK